MNISLLYNTFMGETSPLIAARIDTPAHEMGARRMENMIPMLTGGIRKRPGTWFDGTTQDNKEARLIDWLLSDGTVLILELTAGAINLWRDSREFSEDEDMTARANDHADALLQITGMGDYPDLEESPDDIAKANHNADELIELLGIAELTEEELIILFEKHYTGKRPYRVIQKIINRYTTKQMKSVHFAASANSLWLVHTEQRPMKLTWNGIYAVMTYPTFIGKDFTAENNRPGAVAFDSGRLCFAGTISEPNRIYMSRAPDSMTGTDRYTDFTAGENPSDAIVLEENDMHGSRIQWIAASKHFLAATERATWNDTGDIPTPATFDMNIIEYAGSNELQARGTKETMVYAGRSGKTLRALVWNENTQGSGYIDLDISEQAAHLLGAGIKDFAVADFPYPIIWIVTKAGELISCTINIRGGVTAFARHPTDGKVEAVAVAPQAIGDVVFLEVQRGKSRNIEHLTLEDLVNEDIEDSHYVDAGEKRIYIEPTATITDLQRFAGKTIRIFADGAIEPPIKESRDGKAQLQTAAARVHIGLGYKAAFSPNERQIPANGTSIGKKRRIEKIILKMYKSLGGRAGTTEGKSTELITQRFGSYKLGTAPEPFTGEIDITVSGNIDTEGKLEVTQDEPAPFTMLALVERVAILEA